MEALKPCPFCGSSRVDSHFVRDGRRIACGCGAGMTRHHGKSGDTEGDVRAAWNTRSDHSPALLEALKAIIDMVDRCVAEDDLSITDEFTDEMETKARAAISQAEGGE